MTGFSVATGVHNMLRNCADARAQQSLLIAYEPAHYGYFDGDIVECVAQEAGKLGLVVDRFDVGFDAVAPNLSPELHARMMQADIVVFLARLGDQLRFSEMPQGPKILNSFTLNMGLLGSSFATAHYEAFVALQTAVDTLIADARNISVTCPAGTHMHGRTTHQDAGPSDTTLTRFPVSVFSPVLAEGFSGRVALGGFLTGTGSRYYDNYTVEFEGQVFAELHNGRLTGFAGSAADVAKADAQYDRVSDMFQIDRGFVHSWHAGIHPGCGFPWDMRQDYNRWGGSAFGNPRILHFHTCGAYAPGEISWNVFDPTIEIDGTVYWEKGRFLAHRLHGGAEILERFPCAGLAFANPDFNIGLLDSA